MQDWTGYEAAITVLPPLVVPLADRMPKRVEGSGKRVVRAIMPGLVRALPLVPGARVAAGDIIAIIEAMKLENPIRAEHDGIVDQIHVGEGDTVAAAEEIVTLTAP